MSGEIGSIKEIVKIDIRLYYLFLLLFIKSLYKHIKEMHDARIIF